LSGKTYFDGGAFLLVRKHPALPGNKEKIEILREFYSLMGDGE